MTVVAIDSVRFVKELYPRLREDDAAVERYRAALDLLPPIVIARDGVLVDGFHRWQAYRKEGRTEIDAENLGNLTDLEIRKESLRRNAAHGQQLSKQDKGRQAGELYLLGVGEDELLALLSITPNYLEKCLREAKATEKQRLKDDLWDRWLNCEFDSYSAAGRAIGIDADTAKKWLSDFSTQDDFSDPPTSRQHFDVWNFATDDDPKAYFGKMPNQVVENLLWLYTEPGQIIVDPFVGAGTTIDVAKAMGRRVWASDRKPATPTLPIHEHDITTGWPGDAPKTADFVLLDPPYWCQAKDRYSDDPEDLGNMSLDDFMGAWETTVKTCADHLAGRLAFIVSPAETKTDVVDLAHLMYRACEDIGLVGERRIIVTYNTQQATGQQVEWARRERKLLKLYRDLVVMRP